MAACRFLCCPRGPLASGAAFVWLDRQLDAMSQGPTYLRRPEIARVVIGAIHKGVDLGHYHLGAYVVMSNHVHLLLRPVIEPSRLLKSLKGATAREANRLLGRTGEPFWQKKSYDHCVRNESELGKDQSSILKIIRLRQVWYGMRPTFPGRAQASRRVSTRHARVRAPR
jgi:hypothetical protein